MITVNVEKGEKLPFKKNEIKYLAKCFTKDLDVKIESLILNFVSENTIMKLNAEYKSHNYITDILTFDLTEESESNKGITAELYICPAEAARNAAKYKVTLENELYRLVAHGILHLAGYDDSNVSEKRTMKKMEDELINSVPFYKLPLE